MTSLHSPTVAQFKFGGLEQQIKIGISYPWLFSRTSLPPYATKADRHDLPKLQSDLLAPWQGVLPSVRCTTHDVCYTLDLDHHPFPVRPHLESLVQVRASPPLNSLSTSSVLSRNSDILGNCLTRTNFHSLRCISSRSIKTPTGPSGFASST